MLLQLNAEQVNYNSGLQLWNDPFDPFCDTILQLTTLLLGVLELACLTGADTVLIVARTKDELGKTTYYVLPTDLSQ